MQRRGAIGPSQRGRLANYNARAGIRTRTGLPPRDFKGLEALGARGTLEGAERAKARENPQKRGTSGAMAGAIEAEPMAAEL